MTTNKLCQCCRVMEKLCPGGYHSCLAEDSSYNTLIFEIGLSFPSFPQVYNRLNIHRNHVLQTCLNKELLLEKGGI